MTQLLAIVDAYLPESGLWDNVPCQINVETTNIGVEPTVSAIMDTIS